MKCLYCECTESKVIDSRSADEDKAIRRRRESITLLSVQSQYKHFIFSLLQNGLTTKFSNSRKP